MVQTIFYDRIYAVTAPAAEFGVRLDLPAGTAQLDIPPEFSAVDEIIAPTSYKALSADDPAFALFVVYPNAGLVECCRRSGSLLRNIKWGHSGFRARPEIQNHTVLSANALALGSPC